MDSKAVEFCLAKTCASAEVKKIVESLPVKLLGYPFFRLGIPNNLHTAGLVQRIRRAKMPFVAVPKRLSRPNVRQLRIGMVGELTFGGARPLSLTENFPAQHELFLFDAGGKDRFGPIPQRPNTHFSRHDLGGDYSKIASKTIGSGEDYIKAICNLTDEINTSKLDILIIANASLEEKNDIATLCNTPCLVSHLMGSEPVYNTKIDFTLYAQANTWSYIKNHRLHSIFTNRPLPAEVCCNLAQHLYERNPSPLPDIPWEQREPLLFFHGRLAQIHSQGYLTLLAGLLENDRNLRFEFLGPGDAKPVLQFFANRGLAGQVKYLGVIDKALYQTGDFHEKIYSTLMRARLEPNPWPLGGGISRIEAYQAGTPTVHLRMNHHRDWVTGASWVDLPDIEIPSATADTVEEYQLLCQKCLYDKEFAAKIRQEQHRVANRVVDAEAWWDRVIVLYREWLTRTGWAASLPEPRRTSPSGN